jgi:hypothetical protein
MQSYEEPELVAELPQKFEKGSAPASISAL